MSRILATASAALAAGLVFAPPAFAFDCAKAATPVEKAICETPFLADLDRIMDELYRGVAAKLEGPKRVALTNGQNQWLMARNTKCGKAKPDTGCLDGMYKDRIVALAREWRAAGGETAGSAISARYTYREKGESGEIVLAEMPDGSVYVQVETVNVNHRSPHSCSFNGKLTTRTGDVLEYREPETSKTCGLKISVKGNRLEFSETPKDCFELSRNYCGMHGFMLGNYTRR